jgi:hypothetical protein
VRRSFPRPHEERAVHQLEQSWNSSCWGSVSNPARCPTFVGLLTISLQPFASNISPVWTTPPRLAAATSGGARPHNHHRDPRGAATSWRPRERTEQVPCQAGPHFPHIRWRHSS